MVYKFFDKKSASLPDKSVLGRGVNIELKHKGLRFLLRVIDIFL